MIASKFTAVGSIMAGVLMLGAVSSASAAAVDQFTYDGWKIYKRQRCETCHGPTAEGAAAFPNLVNSLKALTKEQFIQIVLKGKNAMPANEGNKVVVEGIEHLYTFLKGRSDGLVPAGDLELAQ